MIPCSNLPPFLCPLFLFLHPPPHPLSPTMETPHITVEAKQEWGETENMLTYAMFDGIPWMFLGNIVNFMRWRYGLPSVPWNRPRALIPHTFLYSPSLAPRFKGTAPLCSASEVVKLMPSILVALPWPSQL